MELVNRGVDDLMEYSDSENIHYIFPVLGRIAFFLFLFFIFFGTHLPFQEKTQDVDEMATSNVFNQIAFTTVFLLSVIALLPKLSNISAFIFREKLLTIFILWCLLSVTWSGFAFVSFKRWFQVFTAVIAILTGLYYSRNTDSLLKYFQVLLVLYVLASIISIYTVPLAKDSYGEWRGLAASKNFLGQSALISAFIFIYSIIKSGLKGKVFYTFMLAVSLVLLFGSDSSTSKLAFMFIMLIWFLFFIDSMFKRLQIGRFVSILTVTSVIAFCVTAVVMIPSDVNSALGLIGEDLTFTGRTDIWANIMIEIKKHMLLGTGFQGFWVLNNDDLVRIYKLFIWIPQQSHNGYLDLWNETGIIGLLIVASLIVWYFINLKRIKQDYYWKWFFIAALLINLQESTLFRPGVATGVMFIFAYIALFMERFKEETADANEEGYQ